MESFTAAEIRRRLPSLTYEHPILAEHPVLVDATIDHKYLTRRCPLDYGRHETPSSAPFTTGIFETLPAEICRMIFVEVDVEGLVALRSTNRYIRATIDAFPGYKAIVEHVPHILRAVLGVGIARSFTWKQLHDACTSAACVSCGDFGGLLYLLTCSRVCLHCLLTEDQFQPMVSARAKGLYGLDKATQMNLPTVKTLPDTYGKWKKWCERRISLVDGETARQAGITLHGSDTTMTTFVTNKMAQLQALYQQRMDVYNNTPMDQRPKRKPSCPPRHNQPVNAQWAHTHRFMCVVRAPQLSYHKTELRAEWGRACCGCDAAYIVTTTRPVALIKARRSVYTANGYIAHFANCPRSHQTMELNRQVDEIVSRGGGLTPELRTNIIAVLELRKLCESNRKLF